MSDTKASAFGTIPALDRAADYLPVLDMSAAAGSNSRNKLITANTLFSSIGTISFRDTSAAFDVSLGFTSSTALTEARTLTVDVKNGNRSVRITGDGTLAMDERPNSFTALQTIVGAGLKFIDDQSAPQWAMTGLRLYETPGTLTDTTSSGTVAAACTNKLGGNTIAASSATTFTDYFSTYVTAPVAGTNVTLTNAWALGADSLYVGTSNPFNITAAGAVTAQNLVTATNAGNGFLALYGSTKDGVALAGRNGGTSSYIASITTAALTGNRTFTIPAVNGNDTFALLGIAQTFTAANIFSANGAASTPALSLTGTILTGQTSTTNKPHLLIEPTGTTSNNWSTAGTLFGGNAPSGFTGMLLDLQINGDSHFSVNTASSGYARVKNSLQFGVGGVNACGIAVHNGDNLLFNSDSNYVMKLYSTGLVMQSTAQYGISDGTSYAGTPDVAFARTSPGVGRISDGSTGRGTLDAAGYQVGGVAGASFSGAITNLTVVNGIITAAS